MQMMQGRSDGTVKSLHGGSDIKQTLLEFWHFSVPMKGRRPCWRFSGLSSVKSAQANLRGRILGRAKCIENGHIFANRIGNELHNQTLKAYLEGRLTLEQVLAETDAMVEKYLGEPGAGEGGWNCGRGFTILETSALLPMPCAPPQERR